MKTFYSYVAAALFAGSAAAHSWVECVKTEVPDKDKYKANPPDMYSWGPDKEKCHGFPRSVKYRPDGAMTVDPGPWGWNEETLYLSYDVGTLPEKDGSGKAYACPERQRTPEKTWDGQEPPIAKAKPGESLLMRHWGNGHSTYNPKYANPMNKDPGVIQIYWKPEWDDGAEMWAEELTEDNWVRGAQGNFSGDAITLYTEEPRDTPNAQGTQQMKMIEHGNYFTFKVPDDMAEGKHTFIWAWRFLPKGDREGKPFSQVSTDAYWDEYDVEFTSCFDVEVGAGDDYSYDGGDAASTSSPAPAPEEEESPEPEKSEPAPEESEPAPEEPEEAVVDTAAAPASGGDDICNKPCVRAGVPSFGTCDPNVEHCPGCVVQSGDSLNCFESCDAGWGGTDCARTKKAKRSVHGHSGFHKRGGRMVHRKF